MKAVVSLDCTGETFSCGVLTESGIDTVILGTNPRRALLELPAHIRYLLESVGATRQEVVGVGVTAGPGSFTGVRLGVTLAKTIAMTCGCGVAEFDTLKVLARGYSDAFSHTGGKVAVALDARRGELYCGLFSLDGDDKTVLATAVRTPEVFAREMLHNSGIRVLVGGGFEAYPSLVWEEFRGPVFSTRQNSVPCMSMLSRMTFERVENGSLIDAERLEPVYHRRADVQVSKKVL